MDFGINFNGDLPFEKIKEGARTAERLGFDFIWVGESIHFKHPFPIITAIAHSTKNIRVGSGIISYFFNRGLHIRKAFETLVEAYGERFAIALAPGDFNALRESKIEPKKPLERLKETIDELSGSEALENTPLFVGASGPKMIEAGSKFSDGLLLNYAHPEHLKWALSHLQKDTYTGAYAPALLLPDKKNEKAILLASAFVAAGSNPSFQEHFSLKEEVEEVRLILKEKRYDALEEKKDFLLERFAICGDDATIKKRIREFKKLGLNQIIFGSPVTYNLHSVEVIARFCSAKSVHRTGGL
ncbi:MAG: LLM class flavin-dependent oxidoreductase [Candidatus Hydrothermarchaeales archaeon]